MRLHQGDARQQEHELLASGAEQQVPAAPACPDGRDQAAQHLVADRVAVLVVDAFEVVDVDGQQCVAGRGPTGRHHALREVVLQVAAVVGTGQGVSVMACASRAL